VNLKIILDDPQKERIKESQKKNERGEKVLD